MKGKREKEKKKGKNLYISRRMIAMVASWTLFSWADPRNEPGFHVSKSKLGIATVRSKYYWYSAKQNGLFFFFFFL